MKVWVTYTAIAIDQLLNTLLRGLMLRREREYQQCMGQLA